MMSLVSVRIDEALLKKMKTQAELLHLSQTDYIRKAIELMNQKMEKLHRRKRLMGVSLRARKSSMKINAEFSEIEHDIKD